MPQQTKTWQTYEEVARQLIAECADAFGIKAVEGKQSVLGESGAAWEIDAKGVTEDGQTLVVECRRYTTSRLKQEGLAGLAWRILDVGAVGGIMVSPLPLQAGAEIIAAHAKIIHVTLSADATPHEFVMRFLNNIRVGLHENVTGQARDHLVVRVYENGVLVEDQEVGNEEGMFGCERD